MTERLKRMYVVEATLTEGEYVELEAVAKTQRRTIEGQAAYAISESLLGHKQRRKDDGPDVHSLLEALPETFDLRTK